MPAEVAAVAFVLLARFGGSSALFLFLQNPSTKALGYDYTSSRDYKITFLKFNNKIELQNRPASHECTVEITVLAPKKNIGQRDYVNNVHTL